MSLRQKIMASIGALFAGLILMVCFWGRPLLQILGLLIALDGLFLHWPWYRCSKCGKHLTWARTWTFCPHCGAWIDYDG